MNTLTNRSSPLPRYTTDTVKFLVGRPAWGPCDGPDGSTDAPRTGRGPPRDAIRPGEVSPGLLSGAVRGGAPDDGRAAAMRPLHHPSEDDSPFSCRIMLLE